MKGEVGYESCLSRTARGRSSKRRLRRLSKLKRGDLVRYKKEFEHRAEFQSGGLVLGAVVHDITYQGFDDPNEQMLDVLFGDQIVFMFGKELELVEDIPA